MGAAGGALREAAGVRALQVTCGAGLGQNRGVAGPGRPSLRPGGCAELRRIVPAAGRAAQSSGQTGVGYLATGQAGGCSAGNLPSPAGSGSSLTESRVSARGAAAGSEFQFRAAPWPFHSGKRRPCGGAATGAEERLAAIWCVFICLLIYLRRFWFSPVM